MPAPGPCAATAPPSRGRSLQGGKTPCVKTPLREHRMHSSHVNGLRPASVCTGRWHKGRTTTPESSAGAAMPESNVGVHSNVAQTPESSGTSRFLPALSTYESWLQLGQLAQGGGGAASMLPPSG